MRVAGSKTGIGIGIGHMYKNGGLSGYGTGWSIHRYIFEENGFPTSNWVYQTSNSPVKYSCEVLFAYSNNSIPTFKIYDWGDVAENGSSGWVANTDPNSPVDKKVNHAAIAP